MTITSVRKLVVPVVMLAVVQTALVVSTPVHAQGA
jgi:hypothetical protein